jgi:L-ascorbate metabolism protein UlaG (beta-lactamase superfamily)
MKKILTCLLAVLGLSSACGQQPSKVAGNATATNSSYEVDTFKTKSGKPVRFYALMHASIRIVYDGKEIEIDPVSKLGNKTIDYTAMPKADYLLVTHEHGDHFNQEVLRLLTGKQTRLVTNKRCADMYGSGEVMANGDVLKIADDLTVEAVPAYNTTEGRQQFHPKGRDNGYILTIDGLRVYIAGDTEDIPEMASIKDIDVAFLPCNQPYTMTTDQLVRVARMVKPKVLFPYHYGQTDVSGIAAQLKSDGIEVRVRHYE